MVELNKKETALQKNQTEAGMKFDSEKPQMDLLFDGMPKALVEVGKVLTFGAKKYAAHNWKNVDGGSTRYKAALIRHMLAHSSGEAKDTDSNLAHLAHVACNALFLLELELMEKNKNAEETFDYQTAGAAVGVSQRVRDEIAANAIRAILEQRVREAQNKVHGPGIVTYLHPRLLTDKE